MVRILRLENIEFNCKSLTTDKELTTQKKIYSSIWRFLSKILYSTTVSMHHTNFIIHYPDTENTTTSLSFLFRPKFVPPLTRERPWVIFDQISFIPRQLGSMNSIALDSFLFPSPSQSCSNHSKKKSPTLEKLLSRSLWLCDLPTKSCPRMCSRVVLCLPTSQYPLLHITISI